MTPRRSAIVVRGLRRSFGDHVVLDGIDLDVAEGTIFALLGPNAEYKPFTPIIETLRGWCVALALTGYVWARVAFAREHT